jgi:hypothetical protein
MNIYNKSLCQVFQSYQEVEKQGIFRKMLFPVELLCAIYQGASLGSSFHVEPLTAYIFALFFISLLLKGTVWVTF